MLSFLQNTVSAFVFLSYFLSTEVCSKRRGSLVAGSTALCPEPGSRVFPCGLQAVRSLWEMQLVPVAQPGRWQFPSLGTGVTQVLPKPRWAGLALPGCSEHGDPASRPVQLIARVWLRGTACKSQINGIIAPGASSGILVAMFFFHKCRKAAIHSTVHQTHVSPV